MSGLVRPNVLAMTGYVPGEQPQGGKFIKLNTNENPYPPSERVRQAILAALDRGLQRYPDPMATAARQAASRVVGLPPEWILCGNGSDDILTIVTRTYVGEAQSLRMPFPSYILYRNLAELQGASVSEIPFRSDWTLDEDKFAGDAGNVALAMIPNPNSPSGTMVPSEALARLAQRLPCPLLIDEAYVDFAHENCVKLVEDNERILVSRSLSKSYALAGLRFGYVVAQPQVIEQLVKVKDSYNCDALAIAGAAAALTDTEWLWNVRQQILASRMRLADGMVRLGFTVQPSQANFVWCTHENRSLKTLYQQLKVRQILVRYMKYADWPEGLRISVGTDDQVDVLLQVIGELTGGCELTGG
jgi:histidinol-phosphate aminotransferase